jgi:hypothetical protein
MTGRRNESQVSGMIWINAPFTLRVLRAAGMEVPAIAVTAGLMMTKAVVAEEKQVVAG